MEHTVHIPVLLTETIEGLNLAPGATVVDATLGGGGHTKAILEKTAPNGIVLGIDWDSSAVERTKKALQSYGNRLIAVQGNYTDIKTLAYESRLSNIRAALLDLGLSRDQLADSVRGFSFNSTTSLDMRFSDQEALTTTEIVNTWSEDDLAHIFRMYGEERHAKSIANRIVATRRERPFSSAEELAVCVARGASYRGRSRVHPATRIFQALRIATNREFENIEKALPDYIDILASGGRLAIITFHSLEDRIVKHYFKKRALETGDITILTKKVIKPSREEVLRNPASRSSKLRIIEKK